MTTTTTTDHAEIKKWVESHNGRPIRVAMSDTAKELDTIKFRFPNEEYDNEQTYQEISWDEWFSIFEHYNLQMVINDDDPKAYDYQLNNRNK